MVAACGSSWPRFIGYRRSRTSQTCTSFFWWVLLPPASFQIETGVSRKKCIQTRRPANYCIVLCSPDSRLYCTSSTPSEGRRRNVSSATDSRSREAGNRLCGKFCGSCLYESLPAPLFQGLRSGVLEKARERETYMCRGSIIHICSKKCTEG